MIRYRYRKALAGYPDSGWSKGECAKALQQLSKPTVYIVEDEVGVAAVLQAHGLHSGGRGMKYVDRGLGKLRPCSSSPSPSPRST